MGFVDTDCYNPFQNYGMIWYDLYIITTHAILSLHITLDYTITICIYIYINISYDYVDVNTHACKFQEHIYLQYIVLYIYVHIIWMKTQLHRAAHLNNRCFSKNDFFIKFCARSQEKFWWSTFQTIKFFEDWDMMLWRFGGAAFTWFFTVKNGQFGRVTGAFLNLLFFPPTTK